MPTITYKEMYDYHIIGNVIISMNFIFKDGITPNFGMVSKKYTVTEVQIVSAPYSPSQTKTGYNGCPERSAARRFVYQITNIKNFS